MQHFPEPETDIRAKKDAELIRRIHAGGLDGGAALDELLRAYGPGLIDTARRIVGSDDLAKDVVQDVFTKLWDTRGKLSIQGNVASYLYRITRNRALNVRVHERAQQSLGHNIAALHDYKEPQVFNTGERAVTDSELHDAINHALAKLSPKLREIFLLRVDQELSSAQVAEVLGIAVSSVHVQMYRATQALAKQLARWARPER